MAHNMRQVHNYLDMLPTKLGEKSLFVESTSPDEIKDGTVRQILQKLVDSAKDDIDQRMHNLITRTVTIATDDVRQLVGLMTATDSETSEINSTRVSVY